MDIMCGTCLYNAEAMPSHFFASDRSIYNNKEEEQEY